MHKSFSVYTILSLVSKLRIVSDEGPDEFEHLIAFLLGRDHVDLSNARQVQYARMELFRQLPQLDDSTQHMQSFAQILGFQLATSAPKDRPQRFSIWLSDVVKTLQLPERIHLVPAIQTHRKPLLH